ncbi:butyrophilin subfamily 1 member A1-like isoform X2 [Macrotis lagotis]
MDIQWYRIFLSNVTYHDGANATKKQQIEYTGRFTLLKDNITKGNMALKIHQVRLSDEGEYQCVLQDGSIQQATTLELKVAAWGSDPQIDMKPLEDGEILLLCRSDGWYPKPQVGWKDIWGKSLPSLSESYSQDGEDLFQIETSLVVQANSTKDVFCSIWHPYLGEQKTKSLPPRVFPFLKKCAWIIAFAIGLQISGLFILGCIYFIRRQCKAKENQSHNEEEKVALQEKSDSKKVSIDAGWRRARKHAEHVTLDPATAHPILILSEDQSQVTYGDTEQDVPKTGQRFESRPCVMGSQGFTSGRHYWEVEVGTGTAWTLGVCKESVNKNGWIILSPEEGFWTMRLYKNCYEVLSNPLTPLPLKKPFSRIGVYLDYEVREVSFYNVTDRTHIYTFPHCSFSGTIYPFFWVSPGASLVLPKVTRENLSLFEVPSDFNPVCVPGELSPTPN